MKAAPIVVLALIALLTAACQSLLIAPELAFVSPLLAATETPSAIASPTGTPTARPRPTLVATRPAGEPAVLALMPLRVGASWVYSVTLDYQEGYQRMRWTGTVTETITEGRREGDARVFRAERTGAFPLQTPPHEPAYFYVALGSRLYQLFDSQDPLDLIAENGEGYEGEQIAAWPAAVGQTWGDPHLISIEGATYRWLVEAQEDVFTPAAGGSAWLDCFRLVFRTNPDVTTHWYCPGVGLVRYQYHHNGSRHDEMWELLRFK